MDNWSNCSVSGWPPQLRRRQSSTIAFYSLWQHSMYSPRHSFPVSLLCKEKKECCSASTHFGSTRSAIELRSNLRSLEGFLTVLVRIRFGVPSNQIVCVGLRCPLLLRRLHTGCVLMIDWIGVGTAAHRIIQIGRGRCRIG